jgi:hypothetical protein
MTNNVCKTFDCRKVLHFVGTGTNLFTGVLVLTPLVTSNFRFDQHGYLKTCCLSYQVLPGLVDWEQF